MTARAHALVIFTAVIVTLASGCASSPEESPDAQTASVTQTAPSLWSPVTPSESNPTAGGTEDETGDVADTTDSTSPMLPGLTEECTTVIRAQTAVNGLFATAMEATSDPVAPSSPEPATTTATTATSPVAGALTDGDVTAVFSPLDGTLPGAMTAAFDTLHGAAQEAVGHAAIDIAQILSEKDVAAALNDVAAYIKACSPPSE